MIVILNLFQDNKRRLPVMLKQVQHDERREMSLPPYPTEAFNVSTASA